MLKRRLMAVAGCLALITAGAGIGAPAWAVAGDATTNSSYGFVVKINSGRAGIDPGATSCSGALVQAQWVLTSASCFLTNGVPTTGVPALASTVTVGRSDLSTTVGVTESVVQVLPRTDRDVALIKLAAPVTGVATLSVGAAAQTGETLRVAGYGRTHTEWVPNHQQVADFTVQTSTATSVQILGQANATPCKGDAGAPTLRETGSTVALVAVSSTSAQGGCDGADAAAGHDATATRVDDLTGWITQTTTQALPGGAGVWRTARLMASGDYNGHGRSDLLVVWTNGRVSVFPSDGVGGFLTEHTLLAANTRWTTAKLITSGDFDGSNLFDLMVVFTNGQVSTFPDVNVKGLGAEKVMAKAGGIWRSATQISAGRFGASQYVSDLIVRWSDGELTLYTSVGGGTFGTEHQLQAPNSLWKSATLLTSGQYSGTATWDLFVRWVDGELDTYPHTTATGLGAEKRIQNTNTTWTHDEVITTGRYTPNALVDDLIVRWSNGETAMYADTHQNQLGTEHILVPPGT